jgi:hypothetical protein
MEIQHILHGTLLGARRFLADWIWIGAFLLFWLHTHRYIRGEEKTVKLNSG